MKMGQAFFAVMARANAPNAVDGFTFIDHFATFEDAAEAVRSQSIPLPTRAVPDEYRIVRCEMVGSFSSLPSKGGKS